MDKLIAYTEGWLKQIKLTGRGEESAKGVVITAIKLTIDNPLYIPRIIENIEMLNIIIKTA